MAATTSDPARRCAVCGKTLGKLLAEGGPTTRQIMDTPGYSNIAYAELHTREPEQENLATEGMVKLRLTAFTDKKARG